MPASTYGFAVDFSMSGVTFHGLSSDQAIELRDLLLREFPINPFAALAADREQTHKERRERIATAVLAGFAAHPSTLNGNHAVESAVEWADALIAALDKEKP